MGNDEDPKWREYLEQNSAQLSTAHKDALLQNDPNLANLYGLLVPDRISEEYFWKRWKYWKDNSGTMKKSDSSAVIRQTEEGDSVNVSITNLSQQLPLLPPTLQPSASTPQNSPDWDSWE